MHREPSNKSCKKNILQYCRILSAKFCWSVSTTTKMQKQEIKNIHVKLFHYQQRTAFRYILTKAFSPMYNIPPTYLQPLPV